MGQVNVVSGHIREAYYFGGDSERRRLLLESNRRVIRDLPATDTWPALPASMFAITGVGENSPTSSEFRGRVIHFGASYSELLRDFRAWREKFERLLRRLYWDDAMAMVQTEWWGDYAFQWTPTDATRDGFLKAPPEPAADWTFRAWRLGGKDQMAELTSDDVDQLEW